MKRFFALITLLLAFAQSQGAVEPYNEVPVYAPAASSDTKERLLYVDIVKLPEKLYVGEVFAVTLKITSLNKHIPYRIVTEGGERITALKVPGLLSPRSIRKVTFYFKAEGTPLVLPSFRAVYETGESSLPTPSVAVEAIRLNPPSDFSGLLARSVKLVNFQSSGYDEHHNIVMVELNVSYGNVKDFRLPGARRQGIDTLRGDLNATRLLYYGIYPAARETVDFSYFNILKNRYEKFHIPIIVKRSSVSTQTTLDPQASEFTKFKIALTGGLIFLWLLLWWRHKKRWRYPIMIILAGAYLLTYLIPLKRVCLKEGATVYLLPTAQSTPFLRLRSRTVAKAMDEHGRYTKIQLPNNRIGWVKHEDLCQN